MHVRTLAATAFCLATLAPGQCGGGMLYPQDSETREKRELGGLWSFRTSGADQEAGFTGQWFRSPLEETGPVLNMPVPASYNDVTQDKAVRDYIGWVWYSRTFFLPKSWSANAYDGFGQRAGGPRIFLRFGSVNYIAYVWVNGKKVAEHEGGHLPFEAEVSGLVEAGRQNLVTVAVNNTLSFHTIPPGEVVFQNKPWYPKGYHTQKVFFDFFNYAGIDRPVLIYTRPSFSVDDVTVVTNIVGGTALVSYSVTVSGAGNASVDVSLADASGSVAARTSGVASPLQISSKPLKKSSKSVWAVSNGTLTVKNPRFWWPRTMNTDVAHLYTLKVSVRAGDDKEAEDIYRLKVGLRTVAVKGKQFLINGKPFYFTGFGRHEDYNVRGRGVDWPMIAKDFNLIQWTEANSFRTSHYPYAEEVLDMCDALGIAVVLESPAVGLHDFSFKSGSVLSLHKQMVGEMIARDKNRPSVVMWSMANEPDSSKPSAKDYFKAVVDHARSLDSTRPITTVLNAPSDTDLANPFMDVICVNRYYGWYTETGHVEVIQPMLSHDLRSWYNQTQKPVMVTEYGADTVAGLHRDPDFIFTEEYQVDLMRQTHAVFDLLKEDFLIGEMIWNFADFMTVQEVTRVVGNRKGIFTRDRQPKASAHLIRERYAKLAGHPLNGTRFFSN